MTQPTAGEALAENTFTQKYTNLTTAWHNFTETGNLKILRPHKWLWILNFCYLLWKVIVWSHSYKLLHKAEKILIHNICKKRFCSGQLNSLMPPTGSLMFDMWQRENGLSNHIPPPLQTPSVGSWPAERREVEIASQVTVETQAHVTHSRSARQRVTTCFVSSCAISRNVSRQH